MSYGVQSAQQDFSSGSTELAEVSVEKLRYSAFRIRYSVAGKIRWSADASPLLQGLEQACACTPNPKFASFHHGGKLALQFAPAGRQSGSFHDASGRWIVIQREQK
jgi:hypothetical protein